ncbi:MAG TPA: exodeoxyribonuclease VII small subunit, partial [Firmicutes bacterium]|nr:exodeoxyribonuclease VII small subunit [Bacillota bacterium]
LDETLSLFKQGKELVKSLSNELETAKNKINEITTTDK